MDRKCPALKVGGTRKGGWGGFYYIADLKTDRGKGVRSRGKKGGEEAPP